MTLYSKFTKNKPNLKADCNALELTSTLRVVGTRVAFILFKRSTALAH